MIAARYAALLLVVPAMAAAPGCGSTRWSDSKRTGVEQLLISDAIERSVMEIDLQPIAGRKVFLETQMLSNVDDEGYLKSTLQQHMLGSGCMLAEKREDAEIVLQARAGAIGTDRNDLLVGVPATSISFAGTGASIPELALAKRTDQRAVAKINLFAYYRESGLPVWQSGAEHVASHSRARWLFGAGPFQDGRIHDRVEFAGEKLAVPWNREIADNEELAKTFDIMRPHVFARSSARREQEGDAESLATEPPQNLPVVR